MGLKKDNWWLAAAGGLMVLCLGSCTPTLKTESKVEVAPVKVEPIHITMDINLHVDQELKETFAREDKVRQALSKEEAQAVLEQYLQQK